MKKPETTNRPSHEARYAGFWRRAIAYLVDGLFLSPISYIVSGILELMRFDTFIISISELFVFMIIIVYFAFMESSKYQATLGKFLIGIKVTDINLKRISFLHALGRNLAKIISWVPIGLGFLAISFTRRKQGWHDKIAGCLVVNS